MGRSGQKKRAARRTGRFSKGGFMVPRTRPTPGSKAEALVAYINRNGVDTSVAMIARYIGISRFTAYEYMRRWVGWVPGKGVPEPIGPERQLPWYGPMPNRREDESK